MNQVGPDWKRKEEEGKEGSLRCNVLKLLRKNRREKVCRRVSRIKMIISLSIYDIYD